MKTQKQYARKRRLQNLAYASPLLFLGLLTGCISDLIHLDSGTQDANEDLLGDVPLPDEDESGLRLVGDITNIRGTHPLKIQAVALVTNLNGTGSNPSPSHNRQMLLGEMQTHQVDGPEQVLASPDTSLATIRGFLPPGAQEGDRIDLEIRIPKRSETTSLRGGWVMRSRMREMREMQGSVHTGHVLALAEGPIVVDAMIDGSDEIRETRGRIVGGGVVQQSRSLGLSLDSQYQTVNGVAMISKAINSRFYLYDQGSRVGASTPRRNNFIELQIPPRYRSNISRYIRVIQSIALQSAGYDKGEHLRKLRAELLTPESAGTAALQLEAIGVEGQNILREGLRSESAEVRYYAAEALAFQNQADAVHILTEAARHESAFRWNALTALSVMEDISANEALISLFNAPSAETRFGAFRALRDSSSTAPIVRGERLANSSTLHIIPSEAPPLVHVSRMHYPEIVIFGESPALALPLVLPNAGGLMIRSIEGGRIRISRFSSTDEEDRQITCAPRLDALIHALSQMGAEYPQLIQVIADAHARDLFDARLVFDALPARGRSYSRSDEASTEGEDSIPADPQSLPSLPSLEPSPL